MELRSYHTRMLPDKILKTSPVLPPLGIADNMLYRWVAEHRQAEVQGPTRAALRSDRMAAYSEAQCPGHLYEIPSCQAAANPQSSRCVHYCDKVLGRRSFGLANRQLYRTRFSGQRVNIFMPLVDAAPQLELEYDSRVAQ